MFDAGAVMAHLDIEMAAFDRKLDEAKAKVKRFEDEDHKVRIVSDFDSTSTGKARQEFAKLDNQISRDAQSRMRSSPQGSLLGSIASLFHPGGAAGGSSGSIASQSVLQRAVRDAGSRRADRGDVGLGPGLFRGIGPGVLGLGTRAATIVGLGGAALGALPALAAPLLAGGVGAVGAGAIALGAKSLIGTKNVKGAAATEGPLYAQAQVAKTALESAMKQAASGMLVPLKQAFGQLPGLLRSITPDLKAAFAGAGTLIQPLLLGVRDIAKDVLPGLGQAFRAAAPLMRPLLDGIGGLVKGLLPGLVILLKAAMPAVRVFSQILGTLGKDLGSMLTEFAPVLGASSVILKALLDTVSALFPIIGKLAAVFANALGPVFVAFAGVIKSLLPFLVTVGKILAGLAKAVLTDLVAAFGAVAKLLIAVAPSLNSFAKALGQVFVTLESSGAFAVLGDALESLVKPLAGLVNALLPAFVRFLPLMLRVATDLINAGIVVLVRVLTDLLTIATAIISRFPAIVPIIIGIVTALKLWQLAQTLLDAVLSANPIGLIIIALAALSVAIYELVTHWRTVWTAVKNVAMDAWNFLTHGWGQALIPGLTLIRVIVEEVRDHWRAAWNAMRAAFTTFETVMREGVAVIVDVFLGMVGDILHGAATAFGWIPGVGPKLRAAASAFDAFRRNVNNSILGINGKTVTVGVRMTSATNPYPGGITGRARQGMIVPGYGGGDSRLVLTEPGETILPKEATSDPMTAAVARRYGVPGFSGGGIVPGLHVSTSTPSLHTVQSDLSSSLMALAKSFASLTSASGGSGVHVPNVGSGVMRWAGMVAQVLSMEGLGAYLASQVLYQMMTESGGNPNAINLSDSNAQAGDPSRGLLQTIMSTFLAYHWPGTSFNIYDPEANTAAAVNYARHRYGPSLMSGGMGMGSGHGYANGGMISEPVIGFGTQSGDRYTFAENGPEMVTPMGKGGGVVFNVGSIMLPEGSSVADAMREVDFRLRVAAQQGWYGAIPGA